MPMTLNDTADYQFKNLSPIVHHILILVLITSSANYLFKNYDQQSLNLLAASYELALSTAAFDKVGVIIQAILNI